jgi:hypothetical protein
VAVDRAPISMGKGEIHRRTPENAWEVSSVANGRGNTEIAVL